jgi:hypothetical protein
MRMRDVIRVMVLAVVMVGGGEASGNSDLRSVYEKNIQIMDDFSVAMDKAANADQVVASLNRYTREMETLGPRIKALREKHPELVEMDERGSLPEELKDLEDKFAAMGMKMIDAMAKVMQYEKGSAVMEAQQRMLTTAQKLMPSGDQ